MRWFYLARLLLAIGLTENVLCCRCHNSIGIGHGREGSHPNGLLANWFQLKGGDEGVVSEKITFITYTRTYIVLEQVRLDFHTQTAPSRLAVT